MKGFKDFLLRGNVVDLAVGIVVGAAFAALVTSFGAAFLNPLIALVLGSKSGNPAGFTIRGNFFAYGSFFTAIITFVITMAVVYFVVVVPVGKLVEMSRKKEDLPPAPSKSDDVLLLEEIRDLLAQR